MVENHDVGVCRARQGQTGLAIFGGNDVEPVALQVNGMNSPQLELVLYDGRDDVATSGLEARLFLSGRRRQLLVIPRGVWHAERNVGSVDVVVVNFPTIPYDHAEPDKYRLPLDTDELPVVLGPGWHGW